MTQDSNIIYLYYDIWRLFMKYLGVLMLSISFLALKIYSKDVKEDTRHVDVKHEVINFEPNEISDLRDDLLEEFNDIKTELILLRTQIQTEMRKDVPDWDKIRKMNTEQFRLQNILNEKKYEYRETVRFMKMKNKLDEK
jgi:ribosomal protein L29